jgi:hypothetical protein
MTDLTIKNLKTEINQVIDYLCNHSTDPLMTVCYKQILLTATKLNELWEKDGKLVADLDNLLDNLAIYMGVSNNPIYGLKNQSHGFLESYLNTHYRPDVVNDYWNKYEHIFRYLLYKAMKKEKTDNPTDIIYFLDEEDQPLRTVNNREEVITWGFTQVMKEAIKNFRAYANALLFMTVTPPFKIKSSLNIQQKAQEILENIFYSSTNPLISKCYFRLLSFANVTDVWREHKDSALSYTKYLNKVEDHYRIPRIELFLGINYSFSEVNNYWDKYQWMFQYVLELKRSENIDIDLIKELDQAMKEIGVFKMLFTLDQSLTEDEKSSASNKVVQNKIKVITWVFSKIMEEAITNYKAYMAAI